MTKFDPDAEVARLKERTQRRRRIGRYYKSRLDKYRSEILAIRNHGASHTEIQMWLRERRIKVARSTVSRWLTKNG
jgi:dTDP-4-amino-4,6-dideoxygalactose transaminase